MFSIMTIPICIPNNRVRGFPFFPDSPVSIFWPWPFWPVGSDASHCVLIYTHRPWFPLLPIVFLNLISICNHENKKLWIECKRHVLKLESLKCHNRSFLARGEVRFRWRRYQLNMDKIWDIYKVDDTQNKVIKLRVVLKTM